MFSDPHNFFFSNNFIRQLKGLPGIAQEERITSHITEKEMHFITYFF